MRRVSFTVAGIVSVALLLAGCGGGSSSSGVAHLSTGTTAGSPADGGGSLPESAASSRQKLVAYSQCMRSHGEPEFPEPNSEGALLIQSSSHDGHTTAINPQSAQFQAAQKACAKLQPQGKAPSPAVQAKMQEAALKFSQCMRSHGVSNFPDPTFSGGGVSMKMKAGAAGGIDPDSPQFKDAQKACQSLQPGPKGGPGVPVTKSSGATEGSSQSQGAETIAP